MDITVLDFCLINLLSYIAGLGTGLIICCKNKDKLLIKSSSNGTDNSSLSQLSYSTPPIMASVPPLVDKAPVKITLE
tara:strand:- start:268 stop:498 length:231 start_codon:yes stop_codon:yes gene_type:complete